MAGYPTAYIAQNAANQIIGPPTLFKVGSNYSVNLAYQVDSYDIGGFVQGNDLMVTEFGPSIIKKSDTLLKNSFDSSQREYWARFTIQGENSMRIQRYGMADPGMANLDILANGRDALLADYPDQKVLVHEEWAWSATMPHPY